MHVQRKFGHWAKGVNYEGSDSNVWHKATVHHIHVDPITARHLDCFHLNDGADF